MAQNTTYDASSITVLEGLEAVRKRPGMYIGSVSTKGLNHLIYEIVDNAVDEHLAGYCSKITVTLEKARAVLDNDQAGGGKRPGYHEKVRTKKGREYAGRAGVDGRAEGHGMLRSG